MNILLSQLQARTSLETICNGAFQDTQTSNVWKSATKTKKEMKKKKKTHCVYDLSVLTENCTLKKSSLSGQDYVNAVIIFI